jgi:hypothetical protein
LRATGIAQDETASESALVKREFNFLFREVVNSCRFELKYSQSSRHNAQRSDAVWIKPRQSTQSANTILNNNGTISPRPDGREKDEIHGDTSAYIASEMQATGMV